MTESAIQKDRRPKTLVVHQLPGIGDLIWHLGYFRAIAEKSQGDAITVLARPSTHAKTLLSMEPSIAEVIEYDRRPRRQEMRHGQHDGFTGLNNMALQLKAKQFDRAILFSDRVNHGMLVWRAGIPTRMGYGWNRFQRLFLNHPPYITPYKGPAVRVFHEVTAFAIAHGLTDQAITPRMNLPPAFCEEQAKRLAPLPRPRYAFAIGTAEAHKQWGAEHFAKLASHLLQKGAGVLLLGGPGETSLAEDIRAKVPAGLHAQLMAVTDASILQCAALLTQIDVCVGNDTGVLSLAAACAKPTICLLGHRPVLDHDPLITCLNAKPLLNISANDVLAALAAQSAPGFEA